MAEVGYDGLRPEILIRFRIHGIDAEFVRELAEHDFHDLSASDLVEAAIHGRWWRRR